MGASTTLLGPADGRGKGKKKHKKFFKCIIDFFCAAFLSPVRPLDFLALLSYAIPKLYWWQSKSVTVPSRKGAEEWSFFWAHNVTMCDTKKSEL